MDSGQLRQRFREALHAKNLLLVSEKKPTYWVMRNERKIARVRVLESRLIVDLEPADGKLRQFRNALVMEAVEWIVTARPRGPGRPALNPAVRRKPVAFSIAPDITERLRTEALAAGESQARIVERALIRELDLMQKRRTEPSA